jgi:hypothetical protein
MLGSRDVSHHKDSPSRESQSRIQMNRVFSPEALMRAEQAVRSPVKRLVRGEDPASGSTVLMGLHENGVYSVVAERFIPESRGPKPECDCPLGHSIAKLGHCRSCYWYRSDQLTTTQPELLDGSLGCPPRHSDGTPHNYEWATYSDDTRSYGVCRCGMDGMSDALWNGP